MFGRVYCEHGGRRVTLVNEIISPITDMIIELYEGTQYC
jgi:hypothetical protein